MWEKQGICTHIYNISLIDKKKRECKKKMLGEITPFKDENQRDVDLDNTSTVSQTLGERKSNW